MRSVLFRLIVSAAALAGAGWTPFDAPEVPPRYTDVRVHSQYVAMPDGVRVAVDVLLPAGLTREQKLPAIFKITRYGRAPESGEVSAFDRFWVTHGFARVLVDERGTGASFGTVRYGANTLGDLRAMVEWVVHQPWSNGRVGAIGNSYEGTTAELLAACGHPAVRAVAPLFSDFNYYTDLLRPGGVFNEWLIHRWRDTTRAMDAGQEAKPVDADTDRSLLKQAIADHAHNLDLLSATRQAEFIDDESDAFGGSYHRVSNVDLRSEIERNGVPMLVFAGWMDAGTVQGALERFRTFSNVQWLFIGPWSHGAGHHADPFAPDTAPDTSAQQRLWEELRFFNRYLNDGAKRLRGDRKLFYVTMGENVWKSTTVWPPAGFTMSAFYLSPGGALGDRTSTSSTVRIEGTSTGDRNRWHTQLTGENVIYADALHAMEALPGFTSTPLRGAIEVTGQPVLRLRMWADRDDPVVLAYLTAVDPQGRPVYLTEGHLRLIQRRLNPSEPTQHTYVRADAESAPAGTEMDAAITFLPLSVLVPKGYRLRLLLASSDAADFPGSASYSAVIDGSSRLELPAKARK